MQPGSSGFVALVAEEEPHERLSRHDWDFPESGDAGSIHSIHPYPAKFVSTIPRTLIAELGVHRGTAVFDPFCGAGTTLVVAQELGHRSIGVDLNPIACLITRVKTSRLPDEFLDTARAIVGAARFAPAEGAPPIPNLSHWFSPGAISGLASLVTAIGTVSDRKVRDHLELALSSLVVRVSNQDSDTRYAAVARSVGRDDVIDQFEAACARLALQKKGDTPRAEVTVLERDILAVRVDEISTPVSLVITSPPYPNAYEYWLYHKYRMWWLGHDPIAVRTREIGARPHYFKKNHATFADFTAQMKKVFDLLDAVLVRGGYVCFVVGRSRIHGVDYDNAKMIAEQGEATGLRTVACLNRQIRAARKAFNLSHARIKTEQIVVLQKP